MTSLVTGGSGFVGSAICKFLAKKGAYVRNMDIKGPDYIQQGIEFFEGDVRDRYDVENALDGCDYVYHTAALVPLTKSGKDFFGTNVRGTINMVELSRKVGVKKFIHISSSAVYGAPKELPITLNTEFAPVEIYGRSKAEAEKYVLRNMGSGIDIVSIRPRTIVGAERLGIFSVLFDWIRNGYNIPIIGSGENLFQFVYIDDVVECAFRAMKVDGSAVFNVGAVEFGTLKKDLTTLIEHSGSRSKVVATSPPVVISILRMLDKTGLSPLAPWHYLTYDKPFYFDLSHIREKLGWLPQKSNSQMLRESYEWYCNSHKTAQFKSAVSVHKRALNQRLLSLIKRFI